MNSQRKHSPHCLACCKCMVPFFMKSNRWFRVDGASSKFMEKSDEASPILAHYVNFIFDNHQVYDPIIHYWRLTLSEKVRIRLRSDVANIILVSNYAWIQIELGAVRHRCQIYGPKTSEQWSFRYIIPPFC